MRNYYEIEAGVKALVEAMNATGQVETIASCEGHGTTFRPPYVYFKTSVEFAASIERNLRRCNEGDKLHDYWLIEGMFNGDFQLVFTLHAPRHEEYARSTAKSLFFFWLHRSRLDKDLKTLSYFFHEMVARNEKGRNGCENLQALVRDETV